MTVEPLPVEGITVVLVDDHRSYAEAMAVVLGAEPDIEVLDLCFDPPAAPDVVARHRPALVLLDHAARQTDGATVAAEIRRRCADTRVIMLTGASDERTLLAAVSAGCAGYVGKQSSTAEILSAMRTVAAGGSLFPGGVLARLLPRLLESRNDTGELTDRERTVLQLLARGWSNRDIATHLHLSVNTVRNHVQGVLTKLGAHSQLEAVATALRRGLVTLE